MAEITPIRPGAEPLDPEVEKVILALYRRSMRMKQRPVPARQAIEGIRKNLKHLALR